MKSKSPKSRRKHYIPAQTNARIEDLTSYHYAILGFLLRHKIARSSHIHMAVGGSVRHLQHAVRLLMDAPLCFIRPRRKPHQKGERVTGSLPKIYEITPDGATAYCQEQDIPMQDVYVPKNLDHGLLRTTFLAPLEAMCEQMEHAYVDSTEVVRALPQKQRNMPNPYRWEIVYQKASHGVTPDKLFALDMVRKPSGETRRALFFLEIDTAGAGFKGEPIERSDFAQSSIAKKIVLYGITYNRNIHRTQFKVDNFRVLFLMRSTERIAHALEVVKRRAAVFGFPPSIFYFALHEEFTPERIATMEWRHWRKQQVNERYEEFEDVRRLFD